MEQPFTRESALAFLENSYKQDTDELNTCVPFPNSRLDWVGEAIFGFTTYDYTLNELYTRKALEACKVINDGTVIEYILDNVNYCWFVLLLQLEFFSSRINWEESIRGSYWNILGHRPGYKKKNYLSSSHFYDDMEQIEGVVFSSDEEWKIFLNAVIEFSTLPESKEVKE